MAFFGVTREKIGEIKEHPNADRLEIAKLQGVNFSFVVPKGQYKVDQEILYFPLDSVLPRNTAEAIGLYGKLAGKNKDRIKTLRLRGACSQGIVAPISILPDTNETDPEKITQILGVTKYEPPVVPCKAGKLIPLPAGLSAYDIEGAERNMDVIEQLMDIPVVVSEKVEGMNFSITWHAGEQKTYVNQRNYSIKPIEEKVHDFWRVCEENEYFKLFDKVKSDFGSDKNITLYGEFIGPGVQGNIYKLKKHEVKFFDLNVNGDYIDSVEFNEYFDISIRVPTVFQGGTLREFLKDQDIVEASHGVSSLNAGTLREGIVIKPEREFRIDGYVRAIVKQRDPIYLSNEK